MAIDHSLDHMASDRIKLAWYYASATKTKVENGAWLNTCELDLAKAALTDLQRIVAIQEQRLTEQPIKQREAA